MPVRIRLAGRYGNALAALLFGALTLAGLSRGHVGMSLLLLALLALAVFNIYIIEKASHLLSEEEWLKSAVRKAELRQKLESFGLRAAEQPPTERR